MRPENIVAIPAGDVAKLTLMRRLITTGVSPAEAAKEALAYQGEIGLPPPLVREFRSQEDLVAALYRALFVLDATFVEVGLRAELNNSGVIPAWQEVIAPLLEMVGNKWARTGKGIEVEHLLSEIIKRLLRKVEVENPVNARPVLLAGVGRMSILARWHMRKACSRPARKFRGQLGWKATGRLHAF